MAAMVNDGDGIFGTHLLAGVHQTTAAHIGDYHAASGTFVAGFVEYLHHIGVVLVAAHGQMHTVHKHGTFLVYAASGVGLGTGGNGARYGICIFQTTLVGPFDDLLEHLVFNPLYVSIK